MMLASFAPAAHAVVIGSRGAIGAAFADALAANPGFALVTRLARPELDLTDAASIAAAAAALPAPPDLVIVATGILHGDGLKPEKSLRDLDAAALARSFAINAIGPALVAQAFLPLLPIGRKTVFAALSARVGSISDNRLGGWHAYRAAKAALNQLIRTLAIEQTRRNPDSIVLALHPGTVDSPLSLPFQRGVATLFPPAVAAGQLLAVIDAATPAQSGRLFDWRGDEIAP
ncbi:short-chain dehydrogenase [alpha proteobacterium AAP81b]|nr:short-chain dehydrogenase [alpha proteobacterium AAP81b]